MAEWWSEFFDDDYAAFHLTNDPPEVIERYVDFIIRTLELKPGQSVFDQCCGIGRISIPLARRGMHMVGVDLAGSYIAAAHKRATAEKLPCEFHEGDAFEFVSPKPCDTAINWFTSFSYSPDDAVNQRQLQCVFDSLKPGGRFLMDFINIPKVMADFLPSLVTRSADPRQKGLIVVQENKPDFLRGVMNSDWTFIYGDGRRVTRRIEPRLYMPHEIARMLERCGFGDLKLMGSVDGEPFERLSKRTVSISLISNSCPPLEVNAVETITALRSENPPEAVRVDSSQLLSNIDHYSVDFREVRGQQAAKRALEVSTAGGHNILLIGPPGSGKTMLAKRLPTILPPLEFEAALELTKIHSVAGLTGRAGLVSERPFRSPHHTISDAGLIGGGAVPRPGEVSLAHQGVLFLDELPEFDRSVLEVLRQPLEDQKVTISRAAMSLTFPSSFMLAAAMNPCPCGFWNDPTRECRCTPLQIQRYVGRISGPLLDRIDIHIDVPAVKFRELTGDTPTNAEDSSVIRQRVIRARERQRERIAGDGIFSNAAMSPRLIRKYCRIDSESESMLERAMARLGLSARAYDRILKVSRTIADLDDSDAITSAHVSEAVHYRSLDRTYWT